MAKDNDLIDYLFNTLLQLIGWIFKKLFSLIWYIITGVFGFIWGLIAGKKQKQVSNNSTSSKVYSYKAVIRDIENAANENDTDDKLKDRYYYLFVNTVLNGNMSVEEKCQGLELLDSKIKVFMNDEMAYGQFYILAIDASYRMLEEMYGEQSMIVSSAVSKFNSDVSDANFKDFDTYLADIFSYTGLLYSPDGKFSLNNKIFQKYNLPSFVLDKVEV